MVGPTTGGGQSKAIPSVFRNSSQLFGVFENCATILRMSASTTTDPTLERRIRQLLLLQETAKKVNSILDLEQLLDEIVSRSSRGVWIQPDRRAAQKRDHRRDGNSCTSRLH